ADEVGGLGLFLFQDFFHQDRAMEAFRAKFEHALADRMHGLTTVENIVQHEHGAAAHAGGRFNAPFNAAAAGRRAVTRDVDVVQIERHAQFRQELPCKHDSAAHDDED